MGNDCGIIEQRYGMTKSTDETQPVGTQSLRILMIAPTSFFADYGCHVRILEEIQILQKMGHQVTVVTYHNGNPVAGVDIRRTLSIPWRRDYEVGSSRHKIGFDILLSIKSLEVALREKFDLIHAHLHEGALIGSVLSRLMDIPMVFDFQGSLTEEMVDHGFLRRDSTFFKPLRKLETWLAQSAPRVLTSSFHAERLLIDRFGCQPERLYTLADCVNSDVFRPASTYEAADLQQLRDTLGIPADRKLVVYLGLLAEHQGISHLLQAMQKNSPNGPECSPAFDGFPRGGCLSTDEP
jgi:glycosyltransferase involved in cell wall biosynthesis